VKWCFQPSENVTISPSISWNTKAFQDFPRNCGDDEMGSNPTVTAKEKGPASLANKGKQGLLLCLDLGVCPRFAHTRQGDSVIQSVGN
jgi:hypothetical protein